MSLRQLVKQQTREAHARLDTRLALDAPGLPLDRYQDFLRGMRGFCAAVEPALRSGDLARVGVDLEGRERLAWLDDDLAWFGLDAPVTPSTALPPMATAPQQLGVAYVLEGSSLGGMVLCDRICARWQLAPGRGASYLHGHGEATGEMWRRFVAMMDSAPLGEADRLECATAAEATFARLEEWLGRDSPR